MNYQIRHSKLLSVTLNMLMPGLAHFLWGDRLFAVFVFLIMTLAAVLAATSLLLPLPTLAIWILLGLPVLFYLFSFADLIKLIGRKSGKHEISSLAVRAAIGMGVLYQLMSPTALLNFGIRNAPDFFVVANDNLAPLLPPGKLVAAYSHSYYVNIPFIKRPIYHSLPERCHIVRFLDPEGRAQSGIVIGLPGESVSVESGEILLNGLPANEQLPNALAHGSYPLTTIDDYSILVASFDYGKIISANQVSMADITGEVRRLY